MNKVALSLAVLALINNVAAIRVSDADDDLLVAAFPTIPKPIVTPVLKTRHFKIVHFVYQYHFLH